MCNVQPFRLRRLRQGLGTMERAAVCANLARLLAPFQSLHVRTERGRPVPLRHAVYLQNVDVVRAKLAQEPVHGSLYVDVVRLRDAASLEPVLGADRVRRARERRERLADDIVSAVAVRRVEESDAPLVGGAQQLHRAVAPVAPEDSARPVVGVYARAEAKPRRSDARLPERHFVPGGELHLRLFRRGASRHAKGDRPHAERGEGRHERPPVH